jgi:hypothetical protein
MHDVAAHTSPLMSNNADAALRLRTFEPDVTVMTLSEIYP